MERVVYQVVPAKAASEFRALPVMVRNLLKLCDGTRSRDEICARSPLPADRTRKILRRLKRDGLVLERAPEIAARRPFAPSTAAWIEGQLPTPVITPPAVEPLPPPPAIIVETASPVAPAPAASEPPAGFSAEEESFFSSSIDHLVHDEYAD